MAQIPTKDYVELDNVDVSGDVYGVHFALSRERVEASGFNARGAQTFIPGQVTYEVTIDFFMTDETRSLLYGLWEAESAFNFEWRADMNSSVSASNPGARGTVQVFDLPFDRTRGEVSRFSATFTADEDGIVFYET